MRSTIVRTVAAVAIVACVATACDSGGGTNSGSNSSAAAPPSGAPGDAAQQVTASIQQAQKDAPITFAPERADLTGQANQSLSQIAKAMQGNTVKISVATHAGYPDADKAKTLSQKRAEAIATALEGQGVAKDRVTQDATGNEKAQGDQALGTQISVAQ